MSTSLWVLTVRYFSMASRLFFLSFNMQNIFNLYSKIHCSPVHASRQRNIFFKFCLGHKFGETEEASILINIDGNSETYYIRTSWQRRYFELISSPKWIDLIWAQITIRIYRSDNGYLMLILVCCLRASTDRTRFLSLARLLCPVPKTPAACTCSQVHCKHRNTSRVAPDIVTGDPESTTTQTRWPMKACCCLGRTSTECSPKRSTGLRVGWGRSSTVARMYEVVP